MNITINNAMQALEAASWCKSNKIDYKLEYWGWPGSTKYKFIFDCDQDLILFSLKWAQ
jgi:hypothetical protein